MNVSEHTAATIFFILLSFHFSSRLRDDDGTGDAEWQAEGLAGLDCYADPEQ